MDIEVRIKSVINVFETGTPQGDYGDVSIFDDGKDGSMQITYGRSQTTEQGNLLELIESYVNNKDATFSKELMPYCKKIGVKPLWKDDKFILLLKKAANDPIMVSSQNTFFDKRYYEPAMNWADKNGFILPLSKMVIYDSFIHSGSIPFWIREKFAERVPKNGGDEKLWIRSYVQHRENWLFSKGGTLAKTVYRTQCFSESIRKNNWELLNPINANGTLV